jgi:hypothetical protein
MKRNAITTTAIGLLALALCSNTFAADDVKTITGAGACSGADRTVTVKDGDKEVVYYLVANDVTKKYGEKLCKGDKVKVTGTVKMEGEKMELTPVTIEAVKD